MTAEHARLDQAVLDLANPLGMLDRVTSSALTLLPEADGSAIELFGDDGLLVCVCTSGSVTGATGQQLDPGSSLSGIAVRDRATLRCDDTEADVRVDLDVCRKLAIRSAVCVPLLGDRDPLGVLTISSTQTFAFDDDALALLSELAGFVSAIVASAAKVASGVDHLLDDPWRSAGDVQGERGTARDEGRGRPDVAGFVADVLAPGATTRMEARARIEHVLSTARLSLVYQPIVDLETGRVVAVEALARFPPPPDLTPDVWFADAATVGLGVELELAAMAAAVADRARLPPHVALAVNLGPAALCAPELSEVLAEGASSLFIELTEHVAVADYERLVARVAEIRRSGVRVTVDDAGAGYASLSHILHVSPDAIKLDLGLTRGVDADPARRSLAKALVSFAHDTGAKLVAEGIETSAELETVRELGIEFGQGFHLGRPTDLTALAPRLDDHGPIGGDPDRLLV